MRVTNHQVVAVDERHLAAVGGCEDVFGPVAQLEDVRRHVFKECLGL